MTKRNTRSTAKTPELSIISRLKKIALTSLELGREMAKEKATQLQSELRSSRAAQLLEAAQKRLEQAWETQSWKPQSARLSKPKAGKRAMGPAKAARLSHG